MNEYDVIFNRTQRNSAKIARLTDVSMPIIYSAVLAEAANAITISTDNSGAAFALKRAELSIIVPAGCSAPTGTSAVLSAQINGLTSGYFDSFAASEDNAAVTLGAVRNVLAAIRSSMTVTQGGGIIINTETYYSDGTTRSPGFFRAGKLSGVSSITDISASLSGSYTFPAGTSIELRGQKA